MPGARRRAEIGRAWRRACEASGIAAGLHTRSGEEAAKRLSEGFTLVTVASELTHLEIAAHGHLTLPKASHYLTPIVMTIPLQLLAYHIAVHRGTDVDQPRNLAKSVTVE